MTDETPIRLDAASRPTIIDVARQARVSPATVSNVLNERTYVEPETRKRVLAAVRKLGYTPNLRARRLRTGRADTIAIFSSMSFAVAGGRARLGFTMEIAAAAAARALENGMALVLVPPLSKERSPVYDLHIDGALVVEPLEDDAEIALLQSRGVPIVCIGRQPGKGAPPFVDLRPYEVARLLLDHLYEQSTRHIALIVGAQPRYTHIETSAPIGTLRATNTWTRSCGRWTKRAVKTRAMRRRSNYSTRTLRSMHCSCRSTYSLSAPARQSPNSAAGCRATSSSPPAMTEFTRASATHR